MKILPCPRLRLRAVITDKNVIKQLANHKTSSIRVDQMNEGRYIYLIDRSTLIFKRVQVCWHQRVFSVGF